MKCHTTNNQQLRPACWSYCSSAPVLASCPITRSTLYSAILLLSAVGKVDFQTISNLFPFWKKSAGVSFWIKAWWIAVVQRWECWVLHWMPQRFNPCVKQDNFVQNFRPCSSYGTRKDNMPKLKLVVFKKKSIWSGYGWLQKPCNNPSTKLHRVLQF